MDTFAHMEAICNANVVVICVICVVCVVVCSDPQVLLKSTSMGHNWAWCGAGQGHKQSGPGAQLGIERSWPWAQLSELCTDLSSPSCTPGQGHSWVSSGAGHGHNWTWSFFDSEKPDNILTACQIESS